MPPNQEHQNILICQDDSWPCKVDIDYIGACLASTWLGSIAFIWNPPLLTCSFNKFSIYHKLAQGSLTILHHQVFLSNPPYLCFIELSLYKPALMSETKESAANTNPVACLAAADDALDFLNQQSDAGSSPRGLADIRHKVDRRILPFMFCCYFLQFIDKVMYNVSFLISRERERKDENELHYLLTPWPPSMRVLWEWKPISS